MTTIRIKLSPQLIKTGEEELLIEIDESVLSEEKLQVKKDRYLFLYMEKIIKMNVRKLPINKFDV